MKIVKSTLFRLLGLTLVLNLVRYLVGGPIEAVTIMEPMHRVMPQYPQVFDNDFSQSDFAISLIYNFLLWFAAVLSFHFMHAALRGSMMVKSLKAFAIVYLSYASLAAVYMNHYVAAVKPFYVWSIIDGALMFTIVALANAWLYPRIVERREQHM